MSEVDPAVVLNLYSLARLEFALGVSRARLRAVASRAGAYYEPFPKKQKTRPFQKKFKSTKRRIIDNPIDPLKDIQNRINKKLLNTLNLPYYLCGGVKGRGIMDNIVVHFGAAVLVVIDIKNFFPSITDKQIFYVWRHILDCSPRIASILTKLTTFEHRLPQGAPTSTTLANLVLYSVDGPIRAKCKKRGIKYSSWVDDLAFSGDSPQTIIGDVVETLTRASLPVAHKKLKIMGRGSRKVLNGVLMGKFPTVLPERVSQLRSGIHKLHTGAIRPTEVKRYVRSLEGGIAQVQMIDPKKGTRLGKALEEARKAAPKK